MADMSNGSESYTGALQQVLLQLGRIDGKLDGFDGRLRDVETQQAAWRELVKTSEQDSSLWKERIIQIDRRVESIEDENRDKFSVRRHWKLLLALILPAALVVLNIVDTMGDIAKGVFGGN